MQSMSSVRLLTSMVLNHCRTVMSEYVKRPRIDGDGDGGALRLPATLAAGSMSMYVTRLPDLSH
jgi:hypothetical protein